jgi:Excalibur calcium-binding domain
MTIALDTSRPPRQHVRIVGQSEPGGRKVRLRHGYYPRLNRWHLAALICSAFVALVGLAYASDERDLTFAQTIYASMHIPNCTTARALGLAPAYRGEPGYRAHLDRDGDGIACEPYQRR